MSDAAEYPIQWIARATGLSAHVIRIWEQRYNAVKPKRTGTNRRLYSDDDIERLKLLRAVTQSGQSIGQVAKWPTEKLRTIVESLHENNSQTSRANDAAADEENEMMDECLTAIKALDAVALDQALKRAAVRLGSMGLLRKIIAPLAQKIGEKWRQGEFTAAHEHFATASLRTALANAARPFSPNPNAPVLIVATPAGQVHELGALLVAAAASNLGWHPVYLGASLPAPELAGAARQRNARAVALSLVYPEDDPSLDPELKQLRELLPPSTALIAGGRAIESHRPVLLALGAHPINDLDQLGSILDSLRTAPGPVLPTPIQH